MGLWVSMVRLCTMAVPGESGNKNQDCFSSPTTSPLYWSSIVELQGVSGSETEKAKPTTVCN